MGCNCSGEEKKSEAKQALGAFLGAVTKDGAIDAKTKELIIFALVVQSRCEICIKMHIEKAINLGITKEELDEAVWCATLIGGAPVRVHYENFIKRNNL